MTGRTAILGSLGRHYAARHTLGQYRSDAITSVCSLSTHGIEDSVSWFTRTLEAALQKTILQNPGLCFGISEQLLDKLPLFELQSSIDRDDVLEYAVADSSPGSSDDILLRHIGRLHDTSWSVNKPAWKLLVLRHGSWGSPNNHERVDLGFFAHHALADGMSCVAFHQQLLQNFNTSQALASWPLAVPAHQPIPPILEDFINLKAGSLPIPSIVPNTSIWAGKDVQPLTDTSVETRARIVLVDTDHLKPALEFCKAHKITLTGLMYAFTCASLARNVVEAQNFRATVPYSLRRFTKQPPASILCHISALYPDILESTLQKIRGTARHSIAERKCVVELAREVNAAMAAELARFPDGSIMADLARVDDIYEKYVKQENMKRGCTFELSNIGIVDAATPDARLTLKKLVFTQCAMVNGPAIGLNCATVKGGPLTITITWQRGIVEESLIHALGHDLKEYFAGVQAVLAEL